MTACGRSRTVLRMAIAEHVGHVPPAWPRRSSGRVGDASPRLRRLLVGDVPRGSRFAPWLGPFARPRRVAPRTGDRVRGHTDAPGTRRRDVADPGGGIAPPGERGATADRP